MNNNDYGVQNPEFYMNKRKCEELRKVRASMARTLGVPDVVRDEPCNFMGECQGTCPACYMEEKALMDRIYELSKCGVVLTIKGSEVEKEQEPVMPLPKKTVIYNPPVPPTPPTPLRPPIVQGMLRPGQHEIPTFTTSPIPEPEQKKRGIFDKIKGKK